MTKAGYLLQPGEGEHLVFNGIPTTFRAHSDWVSGAHCVVEQIIPARRLFPPHRHRGEDQVAIVVSGAIGFRVGDAEFIGEAGAVSVRPRGVPHANWNPTDTDAVMLEITSPGRFEDYFREISAAGRPPRDIAADWGITFVDEWVDDLCQRYGLQL